MHQSIALGTRFLFILSIVFVVKITGWPKKSAIAKLSTNRLTRLDFVHRIKMSNKHYNIITWYYIFNAWSTL